MRSNVSKYAGYFSIVFLFTVLFLKWEILDSKSPIILEGLHATSVNLDYEKYGPHKLFDGKKGYWATMPGAAPDEGVMLYFSSRVIIKSIKIVLPDTDELSRIRRFKIYADGQDKGEYAPNKTVRIGKKLRSLYIRIVDVEGVRSKGVPTDIKGFTRILKGYDSRRPTGIGEIILYDRNDVPLFILPPRIAMGKIKASSVLSPEEAYNTEFLFDSRREFGWAEGSKGTGTGETLRFTFDKQVAISRLKVWNGYQRSTKHFTANERVKNFSFGIPGSKILRYRLADSMSPQVIELSNSLKGREFIFKIEDVYRGSGYTDCVISELRFFDGSSWFMVYTGDNEKRKRKLLKQIKGTVLERIIDRRYNESYSNEPTSFKSKSIILRSNSSFVIWIEDEDRVPLDSSITRHRVLDGNWEIKSLTANRAKIRIFGKVYNISEQFEAYKGRKRSRSVSIFHDILYIDKKRIKGTRVFDKISL